MRLSHFALGIALALPGCFAPVRREPTDPASTPDPLLLPRTTTEEPMPPGFNHRLAWYFPNRLLDLFDTFRFGADVGPGLGADLAFSHHLRAAAMFRESVGLGYQTFRRSPTKKASEDYHYFACGPMVEAGGSGPGWYHHEWDARAELHVLIVGVHAAINVAEIGDFFCGWVLFDPMSDDH